MRRPGTGIAAFSTPTIVHFCVALAVAAILSAPWQVLWHAGLLLGLCGLGGLAYSVVVVRRMRRQAEYQPVLEDWAWHVVFPLVSYVALVVAAPLLSNNPTATLFGVGAAMVLLLFIGIHNAWDNVTYIVLNVIQPPAEDPDEGEGAPRDPEKAGAGEAPPTDSPNHAGQPSPVSPRGLSAGRQR